MFDLENETKPIMQIETLKLFCDIARLSSFSKAAKKNGITQSTASQTINQLEKHLGVQLIDRSQRPWKLTEEGTIFNNGCKHLVDDFHELKNKVQKRHEELNSLIRVASIYSVGLRHMKNSLNIFSEINTKAEFSLKYLSTKDVYKSILNDEVDLGIVSFPKPQRELQTEMWKIEQMILVCPPEHRLSRQKQIAPQQISGEKFIGFSNDLEIRKQTDRFIKMKEIDIELTLEFDNVESIKRAVEIGTGIAILPAPTIIQEFKNKTLIGVPFINNDFVRPLGIIRRKSKRMNKTAIEFIKFLKEESV